MFRARETDMEAFMHPDMKAFVHYGFKLHQGKFRLHIQKKYSSEKKKTIPMAGH